MKNMENGPNRQAIIDQMIEIARHDAPWLWGFHPKEYRLFHSWMLNQKPNKMARNGLKYQRIDTVMRELKRADWNRPVLWPMVLILAVLVVIALPAVIAFRRRERKSAI
jgi:oligopeptide transport system substrate-binding protein